MIWLWQFHGYSPILDALTIYIYSVYIYIYMHVCMYVCMYVYMYIRSTNSESCLHNIRKHADRNQIWDGQRNANQDASNREETTAEVADVEAKKQ